MQTGRYGKFQTRFGFVEIRCRVVNFRVVVGMIRVVCVIFFRKSITVNIATDNRRSHCRPEDSHCIRDTPLGNGNDVGCLFEYLVGPVVLGRNLDRTVSVDFTTSGIDESRGL